MFEEPEDPENADEPPLNPADRAREKADEFRVHAQLAAVFEGPRKFENKLIPGLDPAIARQIQQTIGKLEKSKSPDSPLLLPTVASEAAALLNLATAQNLSTGDYHIHRRPGEVVIVRWLAGEEVQTFYERMQAHFDVAISDFREEEKSQHGWRQEPDITAYLEALDALEVKMEERYLREVIRMHRVFVLSTQSADELDILHLSDYIMGVTAADLVGPRNAPPEEPTVQDRAWFFKLFSLRGMTETKEKMCFFTFMQKSDEM